MTVPSASPAVAAPSDAPANPAAIDRPAAWTARAARWWDMRVNPMLLKDLRIWMRTKKFLGMYFLVLAGSVIGAAFYTVMARAEHFDGRGMWGILCGTLAVAAGAIVPYFVFERFHQELANRATELVLLSALTPAQLVRGKLMSAWCASLLCAAAITPMLVTAYLMGGIDVQVTLFSLAVLTLGAAVMPMLQLFVATLGKRTQALRGLALLVMAGQGILGISGAVAIYQATRFGWTIEPEAWWILLAFAIATPLFAHFLFRLTVAPLVSAYGNRDAAPRMALALFLYGGTLAFALAVWRIDGMHGSRMTGERLGEFIGAITLFMWAALGLGTALLTGTTEMVSRRLRTVWVGRPFRRLLFFPGVRRLTAFFLFNGLILFALLMVSRVMMDLNNNASSFLFAGAGIFATVAAGLAAHLYIVMPLWRNGEPPNAAVTILVVNILLALQATGFNVLHSARLVGDGLLAVAVGFCPPAVFATGMDSYLNDTELITCFVGAAFALVSGLLLIGALTRIPPVPPPPDENPPVRLEKETGNPNESPRESMDSSTLDALVTPSDSASPSQEAGRP